MGGLGFLKWRSLGRRWFLIAGLVAVFGVGLAVCSSIDGRGSRQGRVGFKASDTPLDLPSELMVTVHFPGDPPIQIRTEFQFPEGVGAGTVPDGFAKQANSGGGEQIIWEGKLSRDIRWRIPIEFRRRGFYVIKSAISVVEKDAEVRNQVARRLAGSKRPLSSAAVSGALESRFQFFPKMLFVDVTESGARAESFDFRPFWRRWLGY